ncbi:MAG TPA: site-specific integrase [Kofleriaceae bacterium]
MWRRRDRGFHVRGRVTDPRTGKFREVNRELPNVRIAREAFSWLQTELDRIRAGVLPDAPSETPRFGEYAQTVLERKLGLGRIRAASGRLKWEAILEHHLVPAFGPIFVNRITAADVKAWQAKVATKIKASEMAPATGNTILAVLRQITDEAVDDFDMRDPLRGIDSFDTREHSTYTEEEPNSLPPEQVPEFLSAMRQDFPDHYAFTFLGITTGLRPSSLRPLRRSGPSSDIKWGEGLLIIRRSQTHGDEVMETTKTDLHQRLTLPPELLDVLRWHVDEVLVTPKMRFSELLFPSVIGSFRARSCLDKPFAAVAKKIKLGFRFTPRGLRRTYQDLARAAGVHDAVTRAISGHATATMQLHYSTARGGEVRDALAKVASIATGADVIDIRRGQT